MRRRAPRPGRLTALAVLVAPLAVAGLTVAFNVLLERSLDGAGWPEPWATTSRWPRRTAAREFRLDLPV